MFLPVRNLLFGAILTVALSAVASADTIEATFNGVTKSTTVKVSTNSGTYGSWTSVKTGLSTFTRTGGDFSLDPLAPGASILAFCIQLEQSISTGANVTFDVVELEDGRTPPPAIGATRAAQIDQLFNLAFAGNNGILSSTISNVVAQAVQIAIWEIISETSGSFGTGTGTTRFKGTNGALDTTLANQVNGYLNQISANPTPSLSLYAMNNRYKQDFVIQVDTPGDTGEIPEPGTMLLTATALLGLSLRLRRRNQTA